MSDESSKHKRFSERLAELLMAAGSTGVAVSSAEKMGEVLKTGQKVKARQVRLACYCGAIILGSIVTAKDHLGKFFHGPEQHRLTCPKCRETRDFHHYELDGLH